MITPLQECVPARDYVNRIGAKWKTLFTAVIETESMGYMKQVAVIRFSRRGEVTAPEELMPDPEEAAAIAEEVSRIDFPDQVMVTALSPANMSKLMLEARDEDLFVFKLRTGEIPFVQVRVDLDNGDKRYVPQTYWSDGVWRAIEPDDGLPLYGLEHVHAGDRVFLHEGAKAARAAQRIADDIKHPFSAFYSTGKHVGWCGGVHYVGKTKWDLIRRLPGELVIVPDADFAGKSKINQLVRQFNCPTRAFEWTNEWPAAWDSADPMPETMFNEHGVYIGPEPEDLLVNCDWATQEIPTDSNKPTYAIKEQFASRWVRVQKLKHYVHMDNPEITMDKEAFNAKVRPYSNVEDTALLLHRISGNICEQVTFIPGKPTGLIRYDDMVQFNQYRDRRIKPKRGGTTKPFHDFMAYLFPDANERHQVMRWIATHYARPELKMGWAILLLSKKQGVGKSTLLNIMAKLTGPKHVSYPGDAMIQSDFNEWLVNKRLVVVHEIYAGQNWKAYNRLKTVVTEETISANAKHVATYNFPSCVNIMAASNSMEALRIEHDDRRWFVPTLPETLYDNYDELYKWIADGGLHYLAYEFTRFNDLVVAGENAPHTAAKAKLVEQSMPMDERLAVMLCNRLLPDQSVEVEELWFWTLEKAKGRSYATPDKLITVATENGFHVMPKERIGDRERTLIWKSPEDAQRVVNGYTGSERSQALMSSIQMPSDVFEEKSAM